MLNYRLHVYSSIITPSIIYYCVIIIVLSNSDADLGGDVEGLGAVVDLGAAVAVAVLVVGSAVESSAAVSSAQGVVLVSPGVAVGVAELVCFAIVRCQAPKKVCMADVVWDLQ